MAKRIQERNSQSAGTRFKKTGSFKKESQSNDVQFKNYGGFRRENNLQQNNVQFKKTGTFNRETNSQSSGTRFKNMSVQQLYDAAFRKTPKNVTRKKKSNI